MKIAKTANFVKRYHKLTKSIQRQTDKQIRFLVKDLRHPSLNTKKMSGYKDWWEFRISQSYRMAGKKIDDTLVLHTIGTHDVGLGKK